MTRSKWVIDVVMDNANLRTGLLQISIYQIINLLAGQTHRKLVTLQGKRFEFILFP